MNGQIGQIHNRKHSQDTLTRARARASLIPELLVEASKVANNIFSGWHGRRKRGIGENFWQFRPYVQGEPVSSIDWRRSARDEHLYIRDREWQAAHTIWLWVDESPSMLFMSNQAKVTKQSRALVLAFAMAELLARSGERVGWLGVTRAIVSRNAAQSLATALLRAPAQENFPVPATLNGLADVILFSDFLDPVEQTIKKVTDLAKRGVHGHLVQIIDPAEEVFPYEGRIEFSDPETGQRITAGNAGAIRSNYTRLFRARRQDLRSAIIKLGWTFTTHHTSNLASQALIALHTHMSGNAAGTRVSTREMT